MEDFKQYLSEDSDDSERAAAEKVREGLAGLRLENKVAEVAAERRAWLRQRFWARIAILVATLVVITGVAFWTFREKETPVLPVELPAPLPPQQVTPSQERSNDPLPKEPIAKRPITPSEQKEEPLVRGVNPELDSETTRLIQILLRITLNNDPTYNLENSNKNYGWGKIVEFLRKNDALEARAEIYNFCGTPVEDKECLWLLGIARLQMGHHDDALATFEKIAKNPEHHRRKEAQLAVEALR